MRGTSHLRIAWYRISCKVTKRYEITKESIADSLENCAACFRRIPHHIESVVMEWLVK